MNLKNLAFALIASAALAALASCSTASRPPPSAIAAVPGGDEAELRTIYAGLGQGGGKVFNLTPQDSSVRIYAFRAGAAARLGHNHVLSAPRFAGFFYLPSGGAGGGRFDVLFRLDQLEIDNPAYRTQLGAAFSSAIDADAAAGTRDHLLGADGMQADRFPWVRVHSLAIAGEAPKFAVRARIQIHGQDRELWIPLDVAGLPDRLSVSGSFVLRQSDFGVQPYSLLGGLLTVQDEVVIDFKLTGACATDLSSRC
jgi:hypothetical protein